MESWSGKLLVIATFFTLASRASSALKLKPKVTNIEFYMHDVVNGPNATVTRVAPSRPLNISSGADPVAAMFGSMYVIDDPLTVTPDPKSQLLGRAQGMYAMASLADEFSLLMTLTYTFLSGPHNGSSLSIVGRNPVMSGTREMPIVGGTGSFRLARGYCLAQTHSSDGMNAVIGYNVTVLHY